MPLLCPIGLPLLWTGFVQFLAQGQLALGACWWSILGGCHKHVLRHVYNTQHWCYVCTTSAKELRIEVSMSDTHSAILTNLCQQNSLISMFPHLHKEDSTCLNSSLTLQQARSALQHFCTVRSVQHLATAPDQHGAYAGNCDCLTKG